MEKLIYIILYLIGVIFIILDVALFVKIWKMTNNVSNILDILKRQYLPSMEHNEDDNFDDLSRQYQDAITNEKLQKIALFGIAIIIIVGFILISYC